MAKQIYVRDQKQKISRLWLVLWGLVAILYVLFIVEPDWFILPPFIHSVQVTGG